MTELEVGLASGSREAGLGGTLQVAPGARVTASIRFRDPETPNGAGEKPAVRRVDVIVGEVRGPASDPANDRNRGAHRGTTTRGAQMHNQGQTEVHQDLGTLIDAGNVMYPEISDYIRTHPERQEVSELADPEFGWIAPLDDAARKLLQLPESATAVVEWNDRG